MTTGERPALGDRIRQLREERGMSQEALARAAGLSVGVVTKLERTKGRQQDVRLGTAVALADALGVTVDELIRPKGEKPLPQKGRRRKEE